MYIGVGAGDLNLCIRALSLFPSGLRYCWGEKGKFKMADETDACVVDGATMGIRVLNRIKSQLPDIRLGGRQEYVLITTIDEECEKMAVQLSAAQLEIEQLKKLIAVCRCS